MRRLSYRPLCFSGLLLLMACSLSPAFGQDHAGQSTWKIVAAPESSDAPAVPQNTSSKWEEAYAPPAPLERPAARLPSGPTASSRSSQPTSPSALQATPQPLPRPIIPSRQLDAANRGEMPSTPLTNEQVRAALGYNGNAASGQTVTQMRRRTPIVPSPQSARREGKPFQTLMRDPTITPWLNLYRFEDLSELPNYFALVRPQLDQLDTNYRNQSDITHLQREVRNVSTAVVGPQYGTAGMPPTGHTARFMDTAQFYGRWNR
jgi:hypothetical protein